MKPQPKKKEKMKATEEKKRGHVEVMEGVSTVALYYTVRLCFRCVPQSILAQLQPGTLLWSLYCCTPASMVQFHPAQLYFH